MTYDSNTVQTRAILRPDGGCVKHPEIKLREVKNGNIYQRDSCPECDKEFAANKIKLEQQRGELERQLAALDTSSTDLTSTAGPIETPVKQPSEPTPTEVPPPPAAATPATPAPITATWWLFVRYERHMMMVRTFLVTLYQICA